MSERETTARLRDERDEALLRVRELTRELAGERSMVEALNGALVDERGPNWKPRRGTSSLRDPI